MEKILLSYTENPPELILQEDDIIFFDLGPVFEDWEEILEASLSWVDPLKLKLKQHIEQAWDEGKTFFENHPDITGAELYAYVIGLAKKYGWDYANEHCGHLIGNFPHELIQGEEIVNYIHPENDTKMRDPDVQGNPRDWILEIHFIDKDKEIGGFFEQLLTVENMSFSL